MIVYRELQTLEKDLGFSIKTLYSVSNSLHKHYSTACVPKRDGTQRKLSVPDKLLKSIQRKIVNTILIHEPISIYATAYKFGSSIQKNALPHINKSKILKLDILNFFNNIYYSKVKDLVFPKERYSSKVRILLTMLCYYDDILPQGAPSSPIISNIILRDFDNEIGNWCKERNISYTRYCDDMTFSGNFNEYELLNFVRNKLFENHFLINKNKIIIARQNRQQNVTGIVVNKKLNLPTVYKKEIRQAVYYCKKHGIESHLKAKNIKLTKKEYLQSLLGKINHLINTCPNDKNATNYKNDILKFLKDSKV